MCLFSRRYRRSRRDECSRLHYFAEKDRLFEAVRLLLFCCLGFVCVNLRDLRETSGVSFVQY